VSSRLGLTVVEAMERLTHREYRMRLAWIDNQWNSPSRTDHYLMRICQLLDALLRKGSRGAKVKNLDGFKISFFRRAVRAVAGKFRNDGEKRVDQSRSAWSAAMTRGKRRGD
jgi:hypothetical protein